MSDHRASARRRSHQRPKRPYTSDSGRFGRCSSSSGKPQVRRAQNLEQRLKRLNVPIYNAHAHTRMSLYTRPLGRFSRFFSSRPALTWRFMKTERATEKFFGRSVFGRWAPAGQRPKTERPPRCGRRGQARNPVEHGGAETQPGFRVASVALERGPGAPAYATSGRVISGDRTCSSRLGPVRGSVLQVAVAVPASASMASRTWCGVVMTYRSAT